MPPAFRQLKGTYSMHVKVILEFLPSRKKHLQFLQKILQISHEDVNHLIRLDVMLDAQSVQVSSTQNHTEKNIYRKRRLSRKGLLFQCFIPARITPRWSPWLSLGRATRVVALPYAWIRRRFCKRKLRRSHGKIWEASGIQWWYVNGFSWVVEWVEGVKRCALQGVLASILSSCRSWW